MICKYGSPFFSVRVRGIKNIQFFFCNTGNRLTNAVESTWCCSCLLTMRRSSWSSSMTRTTSGVPPTPQCFRESILVSCYNHCYHTRLGIILCKWSVDLNHFEGGSNSPVFQRIYLDKLASLLLL